MQTEFWNKYFIDVICNKFQSSFQLLTEVNYHTREENDAKEQVFLCYWLSPGWLGEGLEWRVRAGGGGSEPSKLSLRTAGLLNEA